MAGPPRAAGTDMTHGGDRSPGIRADAIVVAAGTSSRMEGVDKRLVSLGGRPLLIRALEAVAAAPVVERIVLVMAAGPALDAIRPLVPAAVVAIVPGGDHRGASVAAGLAALARIDGGAIDADRVVLVHDGARPLVTPALVTAVAEAAATHGAAVPVIAVTDTVRRAGTEDAGLGDVVDREGLVAAQTPQGAKAGLLQRAFDRFPADGPDRFTDEGARLMACTIRVHPIPGDPVNLKITMPADLERAAAMLALRVERRTGTGIDSHPFGPGEPLRLGGIEIRGAPRLYGHSDGDAALHAVADGLLGAATLGDLGRLFPADLRTPRGISSRDLLAGARDRIAVDGWAPSSVDLTITGARPRLAEHLDAMRAAIAEILGIPVEGVSVKASTGNLDGAAGAGRLIAAHATVGIERAGARPHPSPDARGRIAS